MSESRGAAVKQQQQWVENAVKQFIDGINLRKWAMEQALANIHGYSAVAGGSPSLSQMAQEIYAFVTKPALDGLRDSSAINVDTKGE